MVGKEIVRLNPDIVWSAGDAPYTDNNWTEWGSSTVEVDKDSTAAGEFADHYTQMQANPGWQTFLAHTFTKKFAIFDDHEWGDDNWMHDITSNGPGISATTQAEVNNHWVQGRTAWETYVAANFDNSDLNNDSTTNTVVPSAAQQEGQNPPASAYPVQYGRYTNGDIEIIMLDCISYRDVSLLAPGTGNTMLGSQQLAWAKARVAASTAEYVLVCCSKKAGGTGTLDNWRVYQDEWLDFVDNWGRTGVLVLTGDSHWPQLNREASDVSGIRQWSGVNACPAGVVWTDFTPQPGPETNFFGRVDWAAGDSKAGAAPDRRTTNLFGYCYINGGRLWAEIRTCTGHVYWQGYLLPDTNTVTQTWGVG